MSAWLNIGVHAVALLLRSAAWASSLKAYRFVADLEIRSLLPSIAMYLFGVASLIIFEKFKLYNK